MPEKMGTHWSDGVEPDDYMSRFAGTFITLLFIGMGIAPVMLIGFALTKAYHNEKFENWWYSFVILLLLFLFYGYLLVLLWNAGVKVNVPLFSTVGGITLICSVITAMVYFFSRKTSSTQTLNNNIKRVKMTEENNSIFYEMQKFKWYIPVLSLCFSIIPISFACLASFVCGLSFILLKILIGVSAILVFLFCIARLETRVYPDGLYVRFFPTHIRFKKIAAENIAEYYVRTYSSFGYGNPGFGPGRIWPGVRYSLDDKTWAYIARGDKGVQIVFKDGQKLLIGSQKPQELVAAINSIVKGNRG
jgi:glucan phosphoethanolaminetransferase (alkaline phosphatase superfamily)